MVDSSLDFLPEYSSHALTVYRRLDPDNKYNTREPEARWRERMKELDLVPFFGGDTQGYVDLDHAAGTLLITFRGTETDKFSDIWTDLAIKPTNYACRVRMHSGVDRGLSEVQTQIDKQLEYFPSYTINITGHSLGGMLAQGLAISLAKRGHKLGKLVTFGSPPAGNQALSSSLCSIYKGDFIRVVNCADIVPRSKLMAVKGYRHANGLVYIDRHEQAWTGHSMTRTRRFIDRSLARIGDRRPISLSTKHHSMNEYHNLMKEIYT